MSSKNQITEVVHSMYSSDAIYFSQKQLEADVLAVIRGVYNPSSGKSREKLASWPFIGQWINPLDPKIGKPYVSDKT
jgi:hypothetical protein